MTRNLLLLSVFLASVVACTGPVPSSEPAPEPPPFTDVTTAAGIDWVHENGATDRRYLPETMGAGAAFFDADGDGLPDLFLVGGMAVEHLARPDEAAANQALYRNRGDGTFEDVTAGSGLDVPLLGMGAVVGDVDGDGDLDLYVTAVGGDRLFLNRGDGTFDDATRAWGLGSPGFGSSAAFLDFDRDGHLDLYAGRYVVWSPEGDMECTPDGRHRMYCTPELYPAEPGRLYRNLEGRGFEDVTAAAGLDRTPGKTLGVLTLDLDADGWIDLLLANDTSPNALWRNRGGGTFVDVGLEAGMAVAESGSPRGGMGIDGGDVTGDGLPDLVVGNFAQEMTALYRATGTGVYADEAAQRGIGLPTLMDVTFGALLLDHNGDGHQDLLLANGHIEPEIGRFRLGQSSAQPLRLFRNRGDGLFDEVTGGPWSGPWVGRGLAAADSDRDGDLDVVLTVNGGSPRLLRNDADPESWLRVELEDRTGNVSPYGAVVTAVAGSRRWQRILAGGRSYLSASEPGLHFAWSEAPSLDRLEIRWPSGRLQVVQNPPSRTTVHVREPAGETPSGVR